MENLVPLFVVLSVIFVVTTLISTAMHISVACENNGAKRPKTWKETVKILFYCIFPLGYLFPKKDKK